METMDDGLQPAFTEKLDKLLSSANIAEMMDADELAALGSNLCMEVEADLSSRSEWEMRNERANKLALQVSEKKSFPWPGASNIKFPLITIAALQFHSRAYPALVANNDIVKCKVYGDDADSKKTDRAKRVSAHMSYQVMEEDTDWEEQQDRTLLVQAVAGNAFKKSYFDSARGRNVSDLVLPNDFIVSYYTKSLATSMRYTHRIYLTSNELRERQIRGVFLTPEDEPKPQAPMPNQIGQATDERQGIYAPSTDSEIPYEFYEVHCWRDFDGDGFKEPYIVTVRRDTQVVYRIVARFFDDQIKRNAKGQIYRIEPETYFTKYGFIPSPDGGFYDLGFGTLLSPLNESINTAINQLTDAGTMSNMGGGFLGRGVKIKGGDSTFRPGEWKRIDSTGDDLAKNVFPLPVREPSKVLFDLLTLMISYGERLAGATDALTGVSPGQNTPAETSRNTVEQGMKVFNSIFKRTWRAMKEEFQKLYRLNQLYMSDREMFEFNGVEGMVTPEDYRGDAKDIRPAADPNVVSDAQKLQQAMTVHEMAAKEPGYNKHEVGKRVLEALKVPGIEIIFPDPKGPNAVPPPPNVKLQIEEMKVEFKKMDMTLKMKLAQAKLMEEAQVNQAKIVQLQADAILKLEQAGGVKTGHAIAMIEAEIGAKRAHHDSLLKTIDMLHNIMESANERAGTSETGNEKRAGVPRVEDAAGNGKLLQAAQEITSGNDGAMGG